MSSSTDPKHRQQELVYGVANGTPANNVGSNVLDNTINVSAATSLVSNNLINNNVNNTEQPQTKRQKIEKIKPKTGSLKNKSLTNSITLSPAPDIIDTGEPKNLSSSPSHSAHSIASQSSSDNSPSSTPCSSRAASLTHLLNVQNLNHTLPVTNGHHYRQHPHIINNNDLMSSSITNNSNSSLSNSADEVDRSSLPDLLPLHNISPTLTASSSSNKPCHSLHTIFSNSFQQQQHLDELAASQDMRDFEDSLNKQCLCGVSERMLRKPFQSHYSLDSNGHKRVANLSEWPTNKLLQFLSNLQLLFDIYLKQNSKGFICARIMDVCDALIRNDHNLIDEIIVLAGYSNAYVQFLAGRVLASFLVIAKQEMDDNWLKKLVDNLFNFDRLDHKAVQKIHFSLEIIKRIVEWKDIDLHPLEEEITDIQNAPDGIPSTSSSFYNANHSASAIDDMNLGYLHFQAQQPSLESNYFAVHYRSTESLDGPSSSSSSSGQYNRNVLTNHHFNNISSPIYQPHHFAPYSASHHHHTIAQQQDCHLIALTDSESFDTTHLKCKTIKILENKWPALVENMTSLIKNHLDVENAENCILNFLQLWEKIISVKANLPIGETQPFYAQLDIKLLLNQNLSCTIYKQMLCLFNEALCYGSTLALQDLLPKETCKVAEQIVMHVKDSPISESLPRTQPENVVGLIGFKRKPINYALNSLQHQYDPITNDTENMLNLCDVIKMDKTILQKFVLLVLKSIAVKVKVIRSDSSDSSLDSTDYDAFQDMELIESIRVVLSKLENFIKHTLELLPQCHFSEVLIRLFDDQDDHLIEAMVCTLDVAVRVLFRDNVLPELMSLLNPVYTFLEFLYSIRYRYDLLLDLLVSNETCFLLYLLRFLKCICKNWNWFVISCSEFGSSTFGSSTFGSSTFVSPTLALPVTAGIQHHQQNSTLDEAMSVLIRLRLQISRLVSRQLYPYDISPVSHLLESCERFYEGEPV